MRTIDKMRSAMVCVLVVTCISAQLNTPNTNVKESTEVTRQFRKPDSKGNGKGVQKIEERDGNT